MHVLDLAVLVTAAVVAMLTAVYLWSEDPARRRRARELLALLLRR